MSLLSEYARNQAAWRRAKAEEYPEDERNARSARALEDFAQYLDEDTSEPVVSIVETLETHLDGDAGVPVPGERVSRTMARYGFDMEPVPSRMTHRYFLEDLVPDALEDSYDVVAAVADDDRSPERLGKLAAWHGLAPWEVEAALDGVTLPASYFKRRDNLTEDEQEAWIDAERERGDAEGS